MTYPKVSIIILNWNGLEDTLECLQSLEGITYPNAQIIVVDNGSAGNDLAVLRMKYGAYAHVVANDRNYGFAEGSNIGIRYAIEKVVPDYILLLNNDTVVAQDCLAELLRVAESDPSIGIVGPKVCFYHAPDVIQSAGGRANWWTGRLSLIGCNEVDNGQYETVRYVDWVLGCALLVRSRIVSDIGLLCADYFAYVEEVDWCARARRAGYRVVYAPGARVWHKRSLPVDAVDSLRLYYRTRNLFLLMRRNAASAQLASFLICFFLIDAFRTAALLVRKRQLALLPTFFKAVCVGLGLLLRPGSGEYRAT